MELILPLATCHCTFHCVMILLFIIWANKFSLSLSLSLSKELIGRWQSVRPSVCQSNYGRGAHRSPSSLTACYDGGAGFYGPVSNSRSERRTANESIS